MHRTFSRGLALGLAVIIAAPVSAASRDSDGDVTSVILPIWKDTGGIIYRFDAIGSPIELTNVEIASVADTAGTGGGTLQAGGQDFRVETKGGDVFLRHVATGERYRGVPLRRVSQGGETLQVNPKVFALD